MQVHRLMAMVSAAFLLLSTWPARPADKIYYGSRLGMQVTIVSVSGLDTADAIIRTKHTREDAISFCRQYIGRVSEQCIQQELATRLNDFVSGNCKTGVFSDFSGARHQFKGENPDHNGTAKYMLVNLDTGQMADGTSASGYTVDLAIYRALCPRTAPQDE
jgi:hypothetical protein